MNTQVRLPDEIKVRCGCGWEGTEAELETECTYPGRWYGDPPLPPDYEAVCPECRRWELIEDIEDEQE